MTGRAGIPVLAMAALVAAATDPAAAILDQARGTTAEIFADVVFRLIDAGKIAEKDRAALLDEVFMRADGAHDPMPTAPAAIPHPAAVSYGPHLDALSIKCRALKAMLAVDGKHAREQFGQIGRPHISKPDCKESVLSDPAVYFDTLSAVVTTAPFTAEEQEKQIPFWMMVDVVRGIETSVEIVAAARNLSSLVHSEKEARIMSSAFESALGISDSDRNFTFAVQKSNLEDAVLTAGDKFAHLGVRPQSMQAALRGYLVRHYTASRCEDSSDLANVIPGSFSRAMLAGRIQPLTEEENTPSKVEGKAEKTAKPDQDDFIELANDVDTLDFKEPDPVEIRKVLAKVRDWTGSPGEDAVDTFRSKAGLYSRMLARCRGDLRAEILSGMVATLEDAAIMAAFPSDWLRVVGTLDRATIHKSTRVDGKDVDTSSAPPGNVQALLNSSMPPLQVYGKLAVLVQ